jgi:hypothetical protein
VTAWVRCFGCGLESPPGTADCPACGGSLRDASIARAVADHVAEQDASASATDEQARKAGA